MSRPYPYQEIPLKYHDDAEPMSGTGSAVARQSQEQKDGYQLDPMQDIEAIKVKLRNNGYHLNTETGEVELLDDPEFNKLKGIIAKNRQFQIKPKYHATLYKRRDLIGIFAPKPEGTEESLTKVQLEIAKALWHPTASKGMLMQYLEYEKGWTMPTLEVSDKNYLGNTTPNKLVVKVTKEIIPARDQFSPEVQKLKFGDVFTIFSGSQLEQIKLFLGRVCVGHSGTLDFQTGKKLTHTYRNIMVVDGQYAGQGKSTLFGYVTDALEIAGYAVCKAVPSLNGRFNLHEPFTSDLSYRDDENSDNLAKELSSPVAKVMATNGTVATEQKGKDAVNTKCRTALLINANRLEKRLFWGMDDGMRSRITLCETVPEGVLDESELPFIKIPRLAEELGVDVSTIMLWCLRLATDEFLKYTNENAHKLAGRIKELEASANKSNADPLDGTLAAVLLGAMLQAKPEDRISPKLNLDTLNSGITGMLKLKQSEEYMGAALALLDELSQVDGKLSIPGWHPVQGLRLLDPSSLPRAYELSQNRSRMTSPNHRIKEVFESLSLADGNQCYGRPDVVLPRWSNLVSNTFTFNRIKKLADEIRSELPTNDTRLPVDIDYSKDFFWNL